MSFGNEDKTKWFHIMCHFLNVFININSTYKNLREKLLGSLLKVCLFKNNNPSFPIV